MSELPTQVHGPEEGWGREERGQRASNTTEERRGREGGQVVVSMLPSTKPNSMER